MIDLSVVSVNITASSSGNNTIITAPTVAGSNRKYAVMQLILTAQSAVSAYLIDSNSTNKYGSSSATFAIGTAAGSGFVLQGSGIPWFFVDPGYNLILNLSAAVVTTGIVVYKAL